MKYQLWLYDVWGNARDGYDVNNWHPALISLDGSIFNTEKVIIDINETDGDYAINRKLGVRNMTWEFTGDDINGQNKRNGKPFGFLRPIDGLDDAS